MSRIIIDAGPLAALLHQDDQYHKWVRQQVASLRPPFFTCESVLSETWFLLRGLYSARQGLLKLLRDQMVQVAFDASSEMSGVTALLDRYTNVPMSVADACLVRMSELSDSSTIFTTDSDFYIYRKHGNQRIPLIIPA